jgi:hypothetical protein
MEVSSVLESWPPLEELVVLYAEEEPCLEAVLPPTYPSGLVVPGKSGCPPKASAYFSPPGPDRLEESEESWRVLAESAGGRVVAPEVSVFAYVELAPFTPEGSELRFSENPPPERVDSAARESDATAPADS